MHLRRNAAGSAGLLAGQAKVADVHRPRRIAEIVDLSHTLDAPAGRAGDEVGDAGVAFPEALVGVAQAHDDAGQQGRMGRIGHVPDFMSLAAVDAQQVVFARVALRQILAGAGAHHLRSALLAETFRPRNMCQVFRLGRVGHVHDRGAVELVLAGQGVEWFRDLGGAAVMPDIEDVAVALLLDGGLIGAARLQVVVADEAHVQRFGLCANVLLLRGGRRCERHRGNGCSERQVKVLRHDLSSLKSYEILASPVVVQEPAWHTAMRRPDRGVRICCLRPCTSIP
jgi:hypothetical protein